MTQQETTEPPARYRYVPCVILSMVLSMYVCSVLVLQRRIQNAHSLSACLKRAAMLGWEKTTGHLRKTTRFRWWTFFCLCWSGGLFCSCLCVLSFPIRRRCAVVCSPMRCRSPWRCYRVAAAVVVVVVEIRFFSIPTPLMQRCFLFRPSPASRTSILFRKMTCNMPPHVDRVAAPPSNVVRRAR